MDENTNNEENSLPAGMAELEREIDDNNYDVNSLDILSRSDGSIALALDFRPGFSASHRASQGRRSLNTRKSGAKPKRVTSAVKTRAPPKKSYEPAPFLIIDNLPDSKGNKANDDSKKDTTKSITTSYSHSLKVPRNTPTPTGPSTIGFQRIGSACTLSCSSSEWNKFVPRKSRALYKQVIQKQPNRHVQTPFKHALTSANMEKTMVLPDQKLKEMTVLATYEVAKAIAKQQPEVEHKIQGRLLKARLKPLNTVNVSGPSIHQCRGIVAGTHTYKPSPNRTLERRRQLLQNLNKDYLKYRPQTAESIHHTSVASDNTDARDQEELDYLLLASAGIDEEEAQIYGIPQNSLANFSETVAHQMGHGLNHDIPEYPGDESDVSTAREHRPDKVEDIVSEEDPDIQEVSEAEKYFLESDDDAKRSAEYSADAPATTSSNLHRPMSMHDSGLRKSVRFADATSSGAEVSKGRSRSAMPCFRQDRIPNPRHNEVMHGAKPKGRSSCRPPSSEMKNSWHDDADQDGSGNSSHRTGAWSANSSTDNHPPKANQSAPPRKSASGGSSDKTETVRTSVGEVKFGLDDDFVANERPSSQMSVRHRPRLGEWEDVMKPEDCGNLVISGKGKEVVEREGDAKGTAYKRTGSFTQRGKRPVSAKGPYEFIMEEKRKVIWRARPASASAESLGLDSSVSTMTAVLNVRPQSARRQMVLSAGPRSTKSRSTVKTPAVVCSKRSRPSSGKVKRPTSAKLQKTKSGPEEKREGQGKPCSYCGRPTDKDIDYKQGTYFIVCDGCGRQSSRVETKPGGCVSSDIDHDDDQEDDGDNECWHLHANAVAKCLANEMLQRRRKEMESESDDSTDVNGTGDRHPEMQHDHCGSNDCMNMSKAADAMDSTSEDTGKKSGQKPRIESTERRTDQEKGDVSKSCKETEDEGQILTSLNDLEKSLTDVQTEIKECLRQAASSGVSAHSDHHGEEGVAASSMKSSQGSSQKMETELNGMSDVLQEGAFSSKLVGNSGNSWQTVEKSIRVYQFVEKDVDTLKDNGEVVRNPSNNISMYEATMMSPAQDSASVWPSGIRSLDTQQQTPANQKTTTTTTHLVGSNNESDGQSLEVRATATGIIKQMSESGQQALCPHTTLRFTINARPPTGYMYYFAYGMDMNPDRLSTYIRRQVTNRFWGLLFGFKLLFNKKGIDEEAGGFPNIELCDQSSVEGCLQLITPAELNLLDKCFGYPEHYTHVVLPVWQLNCSEADELGVAQYCVPAVMYIAKDRWTHRGDNPLDSSYAADQCLKGSSLLSPEYIKHLNQYRQNTE